jgi:hypothetical protein
MSDRAAFALFAILSASAPLLSSLDSNHGAVVALRGGIEGCVRRIAEAGAGADPALIFAAEASKAYILLLEVGGRRSCAISPSRIYQRLRVRVRVHVRGLTPSLGLRSFAR